MIQHTNEHILGVLRKLAAGANCVKSFIHMTTLDRLSQTMRSKIKYPVLAVEPPTIILNHEEDSEEFVKKGLGKEYRFNWYFFFHAPSENHRNIDGYLAMSDSLSDMLIFWLKRNADSIGDPLYNTDLNFQFELKEPYVNYDKDGLVGWQISTIVTAKYCKPKCLDENFKSCPHLPYSVFCVESTDGQTVSIVDISQGHDANQNLIKYQYGNDDPIDLIDSNSLPLDNRELVVWLMVTDGKGCYSWSRIHIPACHGKPFCFVSHPSGKCGEIILYS